MQPGDEFYLSAFWDLCTERSIGMSVGPIPWNRIREYSEFAGLDRPNAFAFAAIIRKLDATYLEHLRGDQAQAAGTASKAAAGGTGGREKSIRGRP